MMDSKEDNTKGDNTQRKSKYIDDMTLFMAWQNYQLFNYSWSVYCYSSMLTLSNYSRGNTFPNSNEQFQFQPQHLNSNQQFPPQQQQRNPQELRQQVVRLASLERRIAAEVIDFFLLAIAKTMTIVYVYGNNYLERFEYIFSIDDNVTINDLEWMLLQALMYRLIVVAYEGYFLSGTLPFSRGQTIGKRILGIKVIHCTNIEDVNHEGRLVSVTPGAVGVFRSCFRSIFKNMAISLFFPILPLLAFQHNRLAYDLAVNTLVIDKEIPVQ